MAGPIRIIALLGLVACLSAHATCTLPDQGDRVFYGGQRDETALSWSLVCAHPTKPRVIRKTRASENAPDAGEMRLDAMDKEGVALILSRELANTRAELEKARRHEDRDSLQMKAHIHRLEGDMAALQAELSRAQKR
ncbi:hypothetical protein [Hydrogenophaga sp. PAMC20947]|uniref:hypothetical protein n=1 Tax=Hydrogenophaga sp. PAMC20947 TaxID=2565558 RepID=UPI00109D8284|nr:hypothetical protein [Hydrogenophaga sp. PAMC20947]QCB47253.1 hypothetical protein E5678_15190 [Hydrogenophaga sp. PAMC20947]